MSNKILERGTASFELSPEKPLEENLKKFFVASVFVRIPVALDGNIFVADTFDHVTLRWGGGPVIMLRNTFKDCVLEMPAGLNLPDNLEVNGKCGIERRNNIDIYTVVGGRQQAFTSCAKWDQNNKCVQYSAYGIPRVEP